MTTEQAKEQLESFSRRYKGIPLTYGSLVEACYDTNSIDEMIDALAQPHAYEADMRAWNISASQWRASIVLALRVKLAVLIDYGMEGNK